jgi:DME family drug/metabolite transporter
MHRGRGVVLVLLAAVFWGSTGTAQELGAPTASPLSVGAVRLVVGAVALVAIAVAGGGFRGVRSISPRWALAMAVGVALYQVSFFAAVRATGVALGTVVAIGSAPPLTGLLVWALTRTIPDRRWVVSTLVAITGVVLISMPDVVDVGGVLLALGAGASYALFAVAAERLVAVMPSSGAMALGFGGGAVLLSPMLFSADLSWAGTGSGLAAAIWLGLVTTALAYVLFGTGLRSTPVATVATLSLAEPVTAFVLGVAIVGERLDALGWLGAATVLTALGWMNRPSR